LGGGDAEVNAAGASRYVLIRVSRTLAAPLVFVFGRNCSSTPPTLVRILKIPYACSPTMTVRRSNRALSLSPSRARDVMQCPLLYRFRAVDELPEPPSSAATRGTLVHSVLEKVFD